MQKEYAELIRTASTPYKAKWLANQYVGGKYTWQKQSSEIVKKYQHLVKPREDWGIVRNEIMLLCLRAKFNQNPHCYDVLRKTQDAQLVEHSKDTYWGDGLDGSGKNFLGKLLMQVREELATLPG
eukprot:Phypoly_transcript_19048.p1 GENE.Phypoly_transcript_19048~~Phypoly_transcript_19048.p1  ORF type:complete len:125 (+),score=16.00 Phypoly_transcript_19048:307-681(+)